MEDDGCFWTCCWRGAGSPGAAEELCRAVQCSTVQYSTVQYRQYSSLRMLSSIIFYVAQAAQELQRSDAELYRLEAIDFGRRLAVEKRSQARTACRTPSNAGSDRTSNFILYPDAAGNQGRP